MDSEQVDLYTPGSLIQARKRLWRVDAQEGNVLHVTAVDAAENEARHQSLIEERRAALRDMGNEKRWAAGLDELAVGSWDLLAVKVLWPA